jgi:hypothetical protein
MLMFLGVPFVKKLPDPFCGYTMDTSSRDITTILDEFKNQLIESINKVFEKYKYDKDKEHVELECTHEKDSHMEIKKNQDDCIPNKEGKNEDELCDGTHSLHNI